MRKLPHPASLTAAERAEWRDNLGFSRHTYKNNSQNPISFVKT
ncbi:MULTISPECIES: hypothetical protein [Xanthomonas]|uniref:Uncharacterized protein n=1 Tax=Xanthomonas euvesicatoria TaxID=456327 RepID=A0AAX4FTN0_XANEU|nr:MULTISPECIES: hypothetical protein [Xanthomonas]WOP50618.1 hypothetical protein R2B60_22700 [Xanthomonas euvesicatoria]WOP54795.1 hypothetical protein R5576_22590 [Xanthomonas euvesicatoria]WOP59169.1 hypothetical protein R5577_23525 [Xanthomonas euvesicatoria]